MDIVVSVVALLACLFIVARGKPMGPLLVTVIVTLVVVILIVGGERAGWWSAPLR